MKAELCEAVERLRPYYPDASDEMGGRMLGLRYRLGRWPSIEEFKHPWSAKAPETEPELVEADEVATDPEPETRDRDHRIIGANQNAFSGVGDYGH